ncbi:MAG TPA: phosphodiester glycosidase family protein [Gaiellaceae bacterium]|nr:phosphodiester glycosidase family protein [Gaiellaceae bacterium]
MTAPPEAADSTPASAPLDARAAGPKRRREAAAGRWRRRGRVLVATIVVVLLARGIYSYTTFMLKPTSLSTSVRSVEWLRYHIPYGNWLVDEFEHVYYSWKAPKKGGPQLERLPAVGLRQPRVGRGHPKQVVSTRAPAAAWPPRIKPIFPHPLPGEGVWNPTGPPVAGGPPVLVTTFRTELDYPRIVAYVAWFDHARTAIAFYPGRYEPPQAAVRGPMMVPYDQRWRLLATFNGGFTYTDGWNGSADNGHMNEPLKDGNATLIGYRDGRLAIVKWSGGPNAGPKVAWARQSLPPIIWNGRLNPALNDSSQWGFTLGNAVRVWRTGVGIDRRGNLIYVAADSQTVITLARILQHAGAVRAMQFDINPEWHTLITYTHRHGLVPTPVEPQPMQSATRYLVPDDRDFFAVYRRLPGPVTVPFK